MKTLLLVLFLTAACAAAPRQEIEIGYGRMCFAVRLKFVDGVFSVYAPRYKLLKPDGTAVNLAHNRAQYERLLDSSVSADQEIEIESFRLQDPKHAVCVRREFLQLRFPAGRKLRVDTRYKDDWVLLAGAWQIQQTRILQQSTSKEGQP